MRRCRSDRELRRPPFQDKFEKDKDMGEKVSTDKSDQIRVVEDEKVEEEVVRLDAPKRVALEKKEMASEERAIPAMMGEGEKVEEIRAETFDPEKAWLEEAEEREVKSIPSGWFILLGLLIAGMIFWVANHNLVSADSSDASELAAGPGRESELPLSRMEEVEKKEKAEAHFAAMEELLKNFLGAGTVEERMRFVREPERVGPFMKDFHSRNDVETYDYEEVSEYHVVAFDNFPFLALRVDLEDGDSIPVLIEDAPDGMKVDWESFVCYQPMKVEEFVEKKIEEPTDFRVYAQRDVFYAFDFADEEKFACFKLTFRHSEESIYGYVERNTPLYKEFQKMFPNEKSTKKRSSLIVSMAFEPGSRAPKSVRIHDLLSRQWAYPPGSSGE